MAGALSELTQASLTPIGGTPSISRAPGQPTLAGVFARKVLLPLSLVVAALAAWEIAIHVGHVSKMLLVAPSAVWSALVDGWPILREQAMPTIFNTVVGFLLAAATGWCFGVIIVMSKRLRQALYPHLVMFQLIPKVALAPLFVIWLGVGPSSRLVFALFLAFFPVVIGTSAGLLSADRNAMRLSRSLMASEWQTFWSVRLPYATPHIFAGLKMAATMAMIGVIVGEFITAQQGLGYIIMFASSAGETALVFASIALLCAIGVVLYGLVELAEILVTRRLGVSITTSEF